MVSKRSKAVAGVDAVVEGVIAMFFECANVQICGCADVRILCTFMSIINTNYGCFMITFKFIFMKLLYINHNLLLVLLQLLSIILSEYYIKSSILEQYFS